jgi:hypothetical protein
MQLYPFYPQSNGVAVLPTAVNQAVNLAVPVGAATMQVHVVNLSTQAIFIAFNATAVVPVVGTPGNGFCIPAGAAETVTAPAGSTQVNVIQATAGTGNCYFYNGEGI